MPDSSTADFQDSEEEIAKDQSETPELDAGKLSMIVDLADVISGIKRRKELKNDEIYQFYKNHFVPTKNDQLSHTVVTKKCSTYKLYFKMNWLDENSWLVYSKELEGGLCKACVLFDPVEDSVNRGIFVKKVFRDFGKPEKIREHGQTQYHNEAILRAQEFMRAYEDPTTHVDHDPKKQERFDRNVHILKLLIKAVNLCSKQGLPLRGHRDNSNEEFSRDGNFLAIVKTLADIDQVLNDHLETGSKNAQMTSWKIQNQIISCLAESVRTEIRNILKECKFYSVIADEVTDRFANKEILLLCLRYLNTRKEEPTIEETFISSTHIDGRPTGKIIGSHILEMLKTHKIDVKNCRAQAYDGASAMASEAKGASAIIKEQQPLADSIHCRSHCINLSIAFACKNDVVSKFMDDLTSVCYFFANSPKRQQFFERFIEFYKKEMSISESDRTHIIGLAKTRWVERHKAYDNYYILYKFVISTFESICNRSLYEDFYEYLEGEIKEKWSWDKETVSKAQGLFAACRRFDRLVAFSVLFNGLEPLKPLVTKLQKRNRDIYQAYQMIDQVLKDLKKRKRT